MLHGILEFQEGMPFLLIVILIQQSAAMVASDLFNYSSCYFQLAWPLGLGYAHLDAKLQHQFMCKLEKKVP